MYLLCTYRVAYESVSVEKVLYLVYLQVLCRTDDITINVVQTLTSLLSPDFIHKHILVLLAMLTELTRIVW